MDAATVVWLGGAADSGGDEATARDARQSLEAWAQARHVRLEMPYNAPVPTVRVDWAVVDLTEDELARARDAIRALDANAADRALARAEAALRAHPELPNAAWLMAEVERGLALRWAQVPPLDVDRARAASRRASALDGGRVAGLGETPWPEDAPVAASIASEGGGEIWIDGARVLSGPLRIATGEHAVQVVRGGEVIWAEWVFFGEGQDVRIAPPEPSPCSVADVAGVRDVGGAHAVGVKCESWVAVSFRHGVLGVSTCVRDQCGAAVEWRVGLPSPRGDSRKNVAETGHWPSWVTWTIAGAVAVAAVGGALLAASALSSKPRETRFENGGLRTLGLSTRLP